MSNGILELMAATARKTPAYRAQGFDANPTIGKPTSAIQQLKIRTGALVRYLSAYHAHAIIRNPAAAYGGATRHWEAAKLNFKESRRIIGR
jgi:hypothetical protein